MPFDRPFPWISLEEIKRASPSAKDGLTWAQEASQRKLNCKFIARAGQELKLYKWTVYVAQALCQRFYSRISLVKCDRWIVCAACLLVATRIEGSHRPDTDIARACWVVKNTTKPHLIAWIRDPQDKVVIARAADGTPVTFVSNLCQQLYTAERVLLYTLGFDLNVEPPFKWMQLAFRDHMFSPKEFEELLGMPYRGSAPPDMPDSPADRKRRDECRKTANLLATLSPELLLPLSYSAEDIGKAALWVASSMVFPVTLPPGVASYAELFDIPQARLDEIAAVFQQHVSASTQRASAGAAAAAAAPAVEGAAAPAAERPMRSGSSRHLPADSGGDLEAKNGRKRPAGDGPVPSAAQGTAARADGVGCGGVDGGGGVGAKRARVNGPGTASAMANSAGGGVQAPPAPVAAAAAAAASEGGTKPPRAAPEDVHPQSAGGVAANGAGGSGAAAPDSSATKAASPRRPCAELQQPAAATVSNGADPAVNGANGPAAPKLLNGAHASSHGAAPAAARAEGAAGVKAPACVAQGPETPSPSMSPPPPKVVSPVGLAALRPAVVAPVPAYTDPSPAAARDTRAPAHLPA